MLLKQPSTKWGISRGFGSGHNGIDYKFPSNTPVVAAADGKVDFEGWGIKDPWTLAMGGIYVRLKHNDGTFTGYAHLSKTVVDKGRTVKQGQIIGYSGATGQATGPHLHFEVIPKTQDWKNGYSARINPAPFFIVPKPKKKWATTTGKANVRKQPKVSAPLSGSKQLSKGVKFEYTAIVTGDKVSGNNKWYKSAKGNFVWSGNVKG